MPTGNSYLTFSSPSSFTLNVVDNVKYWNGTTEYSTDLSTWSTWDGTTTLSSASDGTNHNLYLRGTGNTKITGISASSTTAYWVLTGSNISCEGNIENLLDYQTVAQGNHPTMANYCYYYMFYNCTSLITAPSLSATALAGGCYRSMFQNCTALTSAPESLPATTATHTCYYYMFSGCTSLTTAPTLSATTLADNCYESMFRGCTSLTTPPSLPATTLSTYCYASMFQNCTALTSAPSLPATTLAGLCYQYMFSECTSLTTPPALPATTLADSCYGYMFLGCTALTSAPSLPAITLSSNCYRGMFRGCTSLTNPPELPATTVAYSCYQYMFRGCTNIKLSSARTGNYIKPYRIPTTGTGTDAADALTDMFLNTGGTFTGTPTINTIYYLYVQPSNTYGLTHTLSNLTKGNMTFTITPDTGYSLPASSSDITVTNGTIVSYNNQTGVLVINGDDTTEISCECPTAPSGYEVIIDGMIGMGEYIYVQINDDPTWYYAQMGNGDGFDLSRTNIPNVYNVEPPTEVSDGTIGISAILKIKIGTQNNPEHSNGPEYTQSIITQSGNIQLSTGDFTNLTFTSTGSSAPAYATGEITMTQNSRIFFQGDD